MLGTLFLSMFLGSFFLISGFRKTFVASTRAKVFGLFASKGVRPTLGWLVVLGEFFGGLGLVAFVLTPFVPTPLAHVTFAGGMLAAPLLIPIMVGAIKLSVLPILRKAWEVKGNPHWSEKASNFLCTAEVQMTGGLAALTLKLWV